MANHHRKALQIVSLEDRHEHENIRQMHAALVRIVQNNGIAWRQVVAVILQHHAHGLRYGPQMQRNGLRLGNHVTRRIANGRGIIHHILHDFRSRGANDVIGHLVDDGIEAVLDNGEGDGIDRGGHGHCSRTLSGTSIRMLPHPSDRASASGGRTIVVS